MEHFLSGLAVTAVGMVVNFVWSAINIRMMQAMRREFVTRSEWDGRTKLCDERHGETRRLVDGIEARATAK